MSYKALRDFNSLSLKKSFKEGDVLKEDEKLMKEWERQGMAVKEAKPKRQTKEKKAKIEDK